MSWRTCHGTRLVVLMTVAEASIVVQLCWCTNALVPHRRQRSVHGCVGCGSELATTNNLPVRNETNILHDDFVTNRHGGPVTAHHCCQPRRMLKPSFHTARTWILQTACSIVGSSSDDLHTEEQASVSP